MDIKLHKQATTTPKIRAEIQAAPSSITDSELARQYGVATATIRRWRYRDDVHDRSHTRHNLLATLTPEQEEVLIAAREFLRLGLDDLLVVARGFLNPRLSRSGLHRMLKRREAPTLAELARQDAGADEKPRHKPFKDYEPGFVHIDIKHQYRRNTMSYRTLDARVWATNCLTDPDLIYAFLADNYLEDEDTAWDAMQRANRGEPLSASRFPKEMYVSSEYNKYEKLPHVFKAGGFWVVSKHFAEVLRRFDLGQTGLYPVKLFHHDRKTPFEGQYFCLAFGETKDTFVPEESPKIRNIFMSKDVWGPRSSDNEDSLALSSEALQGFDLWLEKKMAHVFFLSDRLYQALNEAGLTKPLKPYRCRVISNLH